MAFLTDQQTINDLNLFDQQGVNSIYQLFNKTSTRGGAAILEEMFRFPLSNCTQITERNETIQYFAKAGLKFPFPAHQLDTVESYLRNVDHRTKLSAQDDSVVKKLSNMVMPDGDTFSMYNGVTVLLEIMKDLNQFLNSLKSDALNSYRSDRSEILRILNNSAFSHAMATKPVKKLSTAEFAEYDEFFRFRFRDMVIELLTYIYKLDVYITVGKVAADRGFIFPKAMPEDQHEVRLEGVYHPQLEKAVPNSISITADRNVIFLTGANMAGKSTFMKSLSIALYMAHMGFPVAAKQMQFSVLDGMFTTINLPDNLGMGASHFYVEVLRIKKIALELKQGKNLFVLFDEMFRGTNVKDACEATIAFTEAFAAKHNSQFVISTHIIEAGEVLQKKCDNINFVYLPTLMNGNQPVYTYSLRQGLTADRHGMVIVNNEGILEILKSGLERLSNRVL
jgi:DNA mismatch repair protein MutS